MYKSDDFRPYLYKTSDYGKTWTKIVNGIPDGAFTRVIREDPARRGLLYAGTETGLYVSFDDGANWQPFQLNLPVVPITDLTVKDGDLVVATQGRAFWALDDLTPVREYTDAIRGEKIHVFKPRPAVRMQGGGFGGGDEEGGSGGALGKNPPTGVVVSYTLKDKLGDKEVLTVEFLDGDRVLRSFTSQKKPEAAPGADEEEGDKPIEPKVGMNRLVWDMRIVKPSLLPKAIIWGNSQGPKVGPGTYSVRFKLGDQTITQPVEVRAHPGVPTSAADLKKQYDLLRSVRDRISETHDTVLYIRDIKAQTTRSGTGRRSSARARLSRTRRRP